MSKTLPANARFLVIPDEQTSNYKKGDVITYNHDIVYEVMKEKLSTLPCWTKYKSYTATGNIPMSVRNIELVQKYTESRLEVEKRLTSINNTNVNVVLE